MRDIRFRGKRVDNFTRLGEWVYGYYYNDSLVKLPGKEKHYILVKGDTCLDPIEVDPETVGQFTGYMDITKKVKIFEGDKVEHTCRTHPNDGKIFINTIEWHKQNSSAGFKVIGKDRRCRYLLNENFIWNHKIKVIGTIHDKQELLK